ncbi:PPE domain-containing protein [Rhodococcus triatomae]|nr:PPE family protein [Rhodococcus triatomae BKS 15-14]
MTLGFTGVVWYPRGATLNSTALNSGIGPAPLTAAGSAWAAVSTSFADATVTVAKVMADLAAGWEGVAATAALSRLAPFQVWTEQASTQAATASGKAAALATAHTVARVTMPSLAEIAAVQAAKVAAYAASGALVGAGAAAEAADRAMDLRASLVMEAYESASTIVASPQSFTSPPPLSNVTAAAPAAAGQEPVPTGNPVTDFLVNPAQAVQNAVGAALAQPANPAVVAAASQAGSIVGTGLSTVAQASASFAPAAAAAIGGAGVTQTDPAAVRSATGAETRAARAGSPGISGLSGATGSSRVTLPEGWGGGATNTGRAASTGVATPIAEPVRVDSAAANRSSHVGAPLGSGGAHAAEDEERRTPGYLKSFEHFEDGRVVIPSVIGGDR